MRQHINFIVIVSLAAGLALLARGQMDLGQQLHALDAHLVRVDARLGNARDTHVVYRELPAPPDTAAVNPAPSATGIAQREAVRTAERMEPPHDNSGTIATKLTERGYMYARDWEALEPQLASMTAEQNKQFWEDMFQAIESGSLEIYDE